MAKKTKPSKASATRSAAKAGGKYYFGKLKRIKISSVAVYAAVKGI